MGFMVERHVRRAEGKVAGKGILGAGVSFFRALKAGLIRPLHSLSSLTPSLKQPSSETGR